MNFSKKELSYRRQRTGILVLDKSTRRKRSPQQTYSKAIHPLNLQTKPMSTKNLELITLDSSESSLDETFEDNKSCCCQDCGRPNKKEKNVRKRFRVFATQMQLVRKQRLVIRFQNAVYCIIFMILKRRKQRQLDKKKMFRYKTKVFLEGSPMMGSAQQSQLPHSPYYQNQQTYHDDKNSLHQHTQSIQAKIIEQRHKQRQSVKVYLQQKLQEKDTQVSLPKIHHSKFNQNSFSTSNIQPLKFTKAFADDQKSPRYCTQGRISHQTEHSPTSAMPQSPYLNQFMYRNQIDHIIQSSFSKTPRPVTKSISQEVLQQSQKFHQRKNTAATLKGLV